jgi:hypothetical protein
MAYRPWTEDEHERARDMRAAGDSYRKIDKVLGRHAGATQQRLEIAGYGSGHHQVRSSRIPDSLFAEREALTAARNQRTLTQDFCGDPRYLTRPAGSHVRRFVKTLAGSPDTCQAAKLTGRASPS